MGRFTDKVVVVTGAGGGIGREHALAFAREGASVVVNDLGGARDGQGRGTSMADAVVEEITALGGRAVANYDSVSTREGADALIGQALSSFGRIDVLVNNAGILRDKTLLKMDEAMFDSVVAVHLKGSWLCMQAAARAMVEQGQGGSILNTSSVAGLKGNFGQTNYAAAKAGIYGLTVSAALELARNQITVNAIAPIAKTRMTEELTMVPDELRPEQVAVVATWLCSDVARDITGRVFGVHGDHVFEYKMTVADGARSDRPWTVDTLAAALPVISGEKTAQAAAPAAESTTASDDTSPAARIDAVFQRMPAGFLPEKAGDWNATLHFLIAGGPEWTLKVEGGKATTAPGRVGTPTCEIKTDVATFLGMVDGSVDGQQAFMQGKFGATNLADLMKYKSSFDREKAKKAALPAPSPASSPATPALAAAPAARGEDRVGEVFARMPAGFLVDKAKGWNAVLHFVLGGDHDHTVTVKDGTCTTARGLVGTATCVVKSDVATFLGMVDGSVDGQQAFMQGKVSATNLADMMKYRTCFSKDRAAAASASPALRSSSSAPSTPATPELGLRPAEELTWIFRLQGELFGDDVRPMRFDLGEAGVHHLGAEGAPAPTRVRADAAALLAFLREGGPATGLLTDKMADLLWFRAQLATRDPRAVIAEHMARQPVRLSAGYAEKTFHGPPVVVTAEHARLYARAIDDTREDQGQLVSPLLAVRYHHELARQALTDPGIELNLLRLLFGEQEVRFAAPLQIGDVLSPKCNLHKIEHKASGSVLTYRFRLMRDGELVNETFSTYFVRGERKAAANQGAKEGPAKKEHASSLERTDVELALTVRPDQSRDYAAASLDDNPIHLNEDIAKAAGFRGIINHGLCTLALAERALLDEVAAGDRTRLLRVAGRFAAPVFMGDRLTIRAQRTTEGLRFEVQNADGVLVLERGQLDLRA